jgi:16S rRNA (cytosine1402-N4)-methyltransferase
MIQAPSLPAPSLPATELSHTPVMLAEMLAALAPRAGGVYLDGTFGGGGYSRAILEAAPCTVWAIDRDPLAVARGAALAARHPGRLHVIEGGFGDMLGLLGAHGVQALDGVVLDLGLSSYQIDDPNRGFSFRTNGPLDMRMGNAGPTAADLVAQLPEAELADTLYQFGEERLSRRIARAIVAARAVEPILTTLQLANIIRGVVPRAGDGIDPATRSFQALRIRVNDELGEITRALENAAALLAPGGRLVVVSFHSLEDRLVKTYFANAAGRAPSPSRHDPRGMAARAAAGFALLTGKAQRPDSAETARNPRARSARLRALQRVAAPEAFL